MIISDKQLEDIRKFLPEDVFALIEFDDINSILDALDDRYLELLDENQEPTEESREVERLRDQIHWDNSN